MLRDEIKSIEQIRMLIVKCRLLKMPTDAFDTALDDKFPEGTESGWNKSSNKIESDNFGYYELDGKIYRY